MEREYENVITTPLANYICQYAVARGFTISLQESTPALITINKLSLKLSIGITEPEKESIYYVNSFEQVTTFIDSWCVIRRAFCGHAKDKGYSINIRVLPERIVIKVTRVKLMPYTQFTTYSEFIISDLQALYLRLASDFNQFMNLESYSNTRNFILKDKNKIILHYEPTNIIDAEERIITPSLTIPIDKYNGTISDISCSY